MSASGHLAIAVQWDADAPGGGAPRAFELAGRRVGVVSVADRWLAPDHRYFKVRGDDGDTYILRYGEDDGGWELTVFQSAGYPDRLSE